MKSTPLFWKILCAVISLSIVASIVTALILPHYNKIFPNSNFEFGTLENWEADGVAFKNQPTYGDNSALRHRDLAMNEGKYWIGTFENRPKQEMPGGMYQGDRVLGELLSKEFTIEKPRITFLMGGGELTPLTSVSLEVDKKIVLSALGDGKKTNTETMKRIIWDVTPWVGKKAKIRIRDHAIGPWGHINVDDFTY